MHSQQFVLIKEVPAAAGSKIGLVTAKRRVILRGKLSDLTRSALMRAATDLVAALPNKHAEPRPWRGSPY